WCGWPGLLSTSPNISSSARFCASRSFSVPFSCGSSSAFNRTVTGTFRLRSIFTVRRSFADVSISSHAPRLGMSLAPKRWRPVFGSSGAEQGAAVVRAPGGGEVTPGGPARLGYRPALGAVDDEGAFVGHHGEVAH